jgi:hypothetical protein
LKWKKKSFLKKSINAVKAGIHSVKALGGGVGKVSTRRPQAAGRWFETCLDPILFFFRVQFSPSNLQWFFKGAAMYFQGCFLCKFTMIMQCVHAMYYHCKTRLNQCSAPFFFIKEINDFSMVLHKKIFPSERERANVDHTIYSFTHHDTIIQWHAYILITTM